jgi:O-antigen ligase
MVVYSSSQTIASANLYPLRGSIHTVHLVAIEPQADSRRQITPTTVITEGDPITLAVRSVSPSFLLESWRLSAAVVLVLWLLLVVGTPAGWLVPWVRILHVVSMAILIGVWVRALTRGWDAVDAASIAVVVAVGLSSVASIVPRLSGDSFFAALAFAALFGLARRMDASSRQVTMRALLLVMAGLTLVFLWLWTGTWIEWTRTTGRPPSLELPLPSGPFGQRHNVATLIGLLVPAALVGWGPRVAPRAIFTSLLLVAAILLFMSGGRAVWLGAGAASVAALAAAGLGPRAARWLWQYRIATLAAALALFVLALLSGFGQTLVARALTTSSLDMRGAIWGSALAVWIDHAVTGWGPGIFTFGLQASDYFDRSVFAPRHSDNLYLQTLSELGILGSLALIALLIAMIRSWRVSRPPPHIVWVLVFAAVVGIGANPAALGYCAILIAFWAGLAAPWSGVAYRPLPAWVGVAAPALLAVVAAVPLVTTAVATLAFDRARLQADVGNIGAAMSSLTEAVRLDPTFPLYRRERGIMLMRTGRTNDAILDLTGAARLNRLDDTTARALALANLEAGRVRAAMSAAQTAVDLRGTDPMNQAVLALAAHAAGDKEERDEGLARLLVIAPWAAADQTWTDAYPAVPPSAALDDASALVADRPLVDTVDQRWTLTLAGSPGVTESNGFSAAQEAFAHLVACRPAQARDVLERVPTAGRHDAEFWFAWRVELRLTGEAVDPAPPPGDPLAGPALGDPAVDQARYARRSPEPWEGIRLPSNTGGRLAWLDDPDRALTQTRGAECP